MQVNTLPSCSKSGNFAKANLELEIEGSYRKMIPFFNFTAMYLLKLAEFNLQMQQNSD